MIKSIEKINKKLEKLQEKKKEIQDGCIHPEILYRYIGSTGNYDPSDDGYTFCYICEHCGKSGFIENPTESHSFKLERKTRYKGD